MRSLFQLALFSGSRAEQYKQGNEYELKKVATDVTNWRLMHRMLSEDIPLALIMEDDFVLPAGEKPNTFGSLLHRVGVNLERLVGLSLGQQ